MPPPLARRCDEEITAIAEKELRDILGISPKAEVLFSRFFRWTGGMPQYGIGHVQRVELIEERSAAIPGLALAGGAYRGVGLPNCIESGEKAVSKVLGDFGMTIAEDSVEEKRAY